MTLRPTNSLDKKLQDRHWEAFVYMGRANHEPKGYYWKRQEASKLLDYFFGLVERKLLLQIGLKAYTEHRDEPGTIPVIKA